MKIFGFHDRAPEILESLYGFISFAEKSRSTVCNIIEAPNLTKQLGHMIMMDISWQLHTAGYRLSL